MKKSELRKIIKEELLRENMIDSLFKHLRGVVDNDMKRRAVAQANVEIADSMKIIADNEDNIRKLLNKQLSNDEVLDLLKKLKS